jgi:hypothetical protein
MTKTMHGAAAMALETKLCRWTRWPPAMRTEPSSPSPRLSARQLDLQLANKMSSIGLPSGYALASLWIFLVLARPEPPTPGAVHGQAYSENNKHKHP